MPEELTGRDFEVQFKMEMAFYGRELVTIAAVVMVTTHLGVDRQVICVLRNVSVE